MKELDEMELKIAKFLRVGVIISGLLIALGWLLNLKLNTNIFALYERYEVLPLKTDIREHWLNQDWGALIAYAGLSFLISLPLIRVLLTGILFIRQKDYLLAIIAAAVLLGLIVSFTFGIEL